MRGGGANPDEETIELNENGELKVKADKVGITTGDDGLSLLQGYRKIIGDFEDENTGDWNLRELDGDPDTELDINTNPERGDFSLRWDSQFAGTVEIYRTVEVNKPLEYLNFTLTDDNNVDSCELYIDSNLIESNISQGTYEIDILEYQGQNVEIAFRVGFDGGFPPRFDLDWVYLESSTYPAPIDTFNTLEIDGAGGSNAPY